MELSGKIRLARAVLRYQVGWEATPVATSWLVTGRCAPSCPYGGWERLRSSAELDTAQARGLIDQMHDAGVLMISFTGGEPLLRDDIGELVRHVKSRGILCKLNTTGTGLERHLEELRGLDLLQMNLDVPSGPPGTRHDPGDVERAARRVGLVTGAGIPLILVSRLTRQTVSAIDDVLRFALYLRAPVHFQPVLPLDLRPEHREAAIPSRAELAAAFEHLVDLQRRRHRLARAIGNPRSELLHHLEPAPEGQGGCQAALVAATMLPDGELIFCANARDYESFSAVELGFRNAFARLTLPECDGCVGVGKLRLSKVFQLDPEVLWKVVGL